MPSYLEITQLASRRVEIKVRGIVIAVTERLMRDPVSAIRARSRLKDALESLQEAMEKSRQADGVEGESSNLALEAQVASMRSQTAVDERELAISTLCSRVESWDLTDGKKKALPLDVEKLYEMPVPTELFREVLEALDKEPIIPNTKG